MATATIDNPTVGDTRRLALDARRLSEIQEHLRRLRDEEETLQKSIADFCDQDDRFIGWRSEKREFVIGETRVEVDYTKGWLVVRANKSQVLVID